MNEKYFSRTACWFQAEDHFFVHDSFSPLAPRMITMEPWHKIVFMAADGQRTVDAFVAQIASEYEDGEPPGLGQQIHEIISTLIDERIVRIHDHAEPLPPYFAEDYLATDPETRKQQMQRDGLID